MGANFRLIWLGHTLSALGDYVVPAALTLAIVRATGSASALALVLACATVPRLVLLPLGGAVADRWQPRRVAIAADVVRCVAQATVAIELIDGRFRLTDLAVAAAVSGAASAFALPTGSPMIAAAVDAPTRPRANALLGVSNSVARVLGPALGGGLVLTAGPGWAFAADAATFAVSTVVLALVRLPAATPSVQRRPLHRDLVEGWSEVRRHDWFWISLIGHATWNMAMAVLQTLGPLIAVRHLGGEIVWVAFLQAGAVGLLAGSLLATRLGAGGRLGIRVSRPVLAANLSLSLFAVPLALLALSVPAPVAIAAYGIALAGLGFLVPVWHTAVQQQVPTDKLARVTAYDILVSLAAMPLGYAVAAPAATAFGNAVPLLTAAALVAVTTAGTALTPGVRGLRTATAV
ncbi:MFS transporter [Planosporangium mesophilum]|uniref:MFS transporter n=1 Tax=Planosporangium mesophilum TaxID=689768 RepID=A0A8J3THG3_9ACTN|nr:MFS transporter [Planosporangium mesophilum]NJC86358.1 MFS transporter [Planosporangium mesophilum]GII25847.1 MFS transporter [Planosporangium mesophilum]